MDALLTGRHTEGLMLDLGNEDPKIRREAAKALGGLRAIEALMVLIKMLGDSDSGVRQEVARALGMIGHIKAVEPLIPVVFDSDLGVRIGASWALGELNDKRVLNPFAVAIGDKEADQSLREEIVWALGKISNPRAKIMLEQIGIHDNSSRVREAAKEALAKRNQQGKGGG